MRRKIFKALTIAVVFLLAALAVLYAWYAHGTSGPGYNATTAGNSLRAALERQAPGEEVRGIRCDGDRDGSNFFVCHIQGARSSTDYNLSYDINNKQYNANGARLPFPRVLRSFASVT